MDTNCDIMNAFIGHGVAERKHSLKHASTSSHVIINVFIGLGVAERQFSLKHASTNSHVSHVIMNMINQRQPLWQEALSDYAAADSLDIAARSDLREVAV